MADQSNAAASGPSVRDRLKAMKTKLSGEISTTLPVSGEAVTYPAFIGHDTVMAAAKLAGKNRSRVGLIVVAQVCRFGGERLTVDEIATLLPNQDTVHLIERVLGADDDADEDGEGAGGN